MCGIVGVVSTDKRISLPFVEQATDSQKHRGPDDSGLFFQENAGLGHTRLSIIDLAGGHQPIFNEDGSRCIVYNGEVYNFLELRTELLARGHLFSTRSDTETILHAYEEWGECCVDRFRGMFAFAIWDNREKKLFLARDRLGIKPVFYGEHGGKFYFSSEMKGILTESSFPRDMDEFALACYFMLSYIPAPLSIFQKIRKLPPGHTLTWQGGHFTTRQFWDLHCDPDHGRNERYFIDRFMELLEESVRMRLMSEVPLGAFLSGGIDSSTVVALMSQVSGSPANTFCIGFGGNVGGYLDERGYARMVAARYGTHHRESEVFPKPDGLVETIVRAFDEPFADDSAIPSYFVCKIARENVTVALSGLGGDEAFAGYERYLGFLLHGLYRRIPGLLREGVIANSVKRIPERSDGHYTINHMKRFVRAGSASPDEAYFSYLTRMNPNIRDGFFSEPERFNGHLDACRDLVLGHFRSDKVNGDPASLNRALYCDVKTYLPEDILAVTDRMSMHHALEVRVPFIDHKLMEFCATIPPDLKMKRMQKKYLLRKAVRDLLPADVIRHRKQGFVGPMTQWLKKDLKDYVSTTLSDRNLKRHDLLNARTVQRLLSEHLAGEEIHDTLIWSILVFQKWYDMYIESAPRG